jgi:hypothetical protein
MGNTPKYIDFGWFNHGPAAPKDPVWEEFKWELKKKSIKVLWQFLKFCVRKWYWSLPISYFINFLLSRGDLGVFSVFVLVTGLCMVYRFKVYKPKVPPVLTEDEVEIARLSSKWSYVAFHTDLTQKSSPEGVGLVEALRSIYSQTSGAKKFRDAGYNKVAEDEVLVPPLLGIEPGPLGYTHTVALLPGQTVETFAKQAARLAPLWDVTRVTVKPGVPGQVLITPVSRNPFGTLEPVTIENYKSFGASVQGVDIGLTESGLPWILPMNQFSGVIAGTPGSGKSVGLNVILSQLAYLPEAVLLGVDAAGGVELADWAPRFSALAIDQDEAIEMLEKLWEIHLYRINLLKKAHKKSVSNLGYSEDLPLIVLVIDEAAQLFRLGSTDKEQKAKGNKLVDLIQNLVTVSRKTGICVFLATQKPGAETIPTGIRDNMGVKVSYRVTTSATAFMVLGDVDMSDISPTDIKLEDKGRAVVADQDSVLQFVHGRNISEETGMAIVEETKHLRKPLSALLPQPDVDDEGMYIHEGEII